MAGKTLLPHEILANKKKESPKRDMKVSPIRTEYCIVRCSSGCKKDKGHRAVTNYYMTKNTMFASGYYPICKDCANEFIQDDKGEIDENRIRKLLQLMDLPFLKTVVDKAFRRSKSTDFITAYLSEVGEWSKKNDYNCSDGLRYEGNMNVPTAEKGKYDFSDLRYMWGERFSEKELIKLQKIFEEFKTRMRFESDDFANDSLIRELCKIELNARDSKEGLSLKDVELKIKLMNECKMTAKSGGTKEEEAKPLGKKIQVIENYTPSEIFEDRKLFRDFDGIKDYFSRYLLRPMKNFITQSKEFDKEFNVEVAEATMNEWEKSDE